MDETTRDAIDRIIDQWRQERPDLDYSPVEVIGRISRLSQILERGLDETFATFGLNRSGFDVLATLRRSGPPYRLTPTMLFRELLRSSGTMTNRIDRLEQAGLVRRIPDPDDRRGVLVELTPEGLDLLDRVADEHLSNERRLLAGLSSHDQRELAALLRKLLRSLEPA